MRYMLMICHEGPSLPGPASIEDDPRYRLWSEERDRRGVHRGGACLRPAEDATTVRVREEEVLLSDGPFAETKELVAHYDIIECEDLDEAVEVVSGHSMAKARTIEIRPFPKA
jgi:hypothetical protein